MAKSKFLEYQDKNNDKLIDVCGTQITPPEEPECQECVPNSSAVVPDWKNTEELYWFNGQECTYEVPVQTSEQNLVPSPDATDEEANDFILSVFESYKDEAIRALLEGADKLNNSSTREQVEKYLEDEKYTLDSYESSRVRLLYSIPHKYFAPIVENGETLEDPEPEEEEESESTSAEISFEIDNLTSVNQKLRQIRFAMYLYSVYYNIDKALYAKTLIYEDSGKLFDLSIYGDATIFPDSAFSKIVPKIDKFLNDRKMDFPQAGGIGSGMFHLFRPDAVALKFYFEPDYARLTRLDVTLEGCPEVKTYTGDSLKFLNDSKGFKDPTALHYFSKVHEMHQSLTSRSPMDWKEFVIKYTSPAIVEKENYKQEVDEFSDAGKTCMTDALKTEGIQLGFDVLNDVFSLADAIAYKFNESACKTPTEAEEQAIASGQVVDPAQTAAPTNPNAPEEVTPRSASVLYALAQEKAFKKLEKGNNTFEQKCAATIASSGDAPNSEVWAELTRSTKVCGLQAMALETMKCLMQGLTLEESLSSIVKAALEAMSIEDFGKLFIGLPEDKKAQISSIAMKQIESDFFADSGNNQDLSNELDSRTAVDPPWTPSEVNSNSGVKTIMDQIDPYAFKNEIRDDTWLQAYAKALIETYDDDLLQIIDILNTFPGAPLIATTISILGVCPVGPIFDPSVADFINSVEMPLCRNGNYELTAPQLQNPFKNYPKMMDNSSALFDAAKKAAEEAIIDVMMKMLVKICEIFGSVACSTLSIASEAVTSIGGTPDEFANIVKDAICGDGISEEDLNNTINDLVTTLGTGDVFSTPEGAREFTEVCSSNVTRQEMSMATLGECTPTFLKIISTIIKYDYPELTSSLGTDDKICKFFTDVGNLFPQPFKEQMRAMIDSSEDSDLPVNPSMCASPQALENFCETRAQLLQGRATSEQSRQMCENDRQEMAGTLEDIAAITQNPEAYVANNLPPIVSDPGCDDGLIPYESEQTIAATNVILSDDLEQLRLEFIEDMMGDGGMPFTDADFGLLNMIMSDTSGNPLTIHNNKTKNPFLFTTNFSTNSTFEWDGWFPSIGDVAGLLLSKPKPSPFQDDALPSHIGLWMSASLGAPHNDTIWKNSNNKWQYSVSTYTPIEELMAGSAGLDSNVDLTKIVDLGYNVEMTVAYPDTSETSQPGEPRKGEIKITYAGRKSTADASLVYYDNAKGQKKFSLDDAAEIPSFINGFRIDLFTNELEDTDNQVANIRSNNARVLIGDIINETGPLARQDLGFIATPAEKEDQIKRRISEDEASIETRYEFFAIDDTLDNLESSTYPNFERCFDEHTDDAPQLILLSEMMGKSIETISSGFENVNQEMLQTMRKGIADDSRKAYKFGASFDGLPQSAFDYMAPMDMQIVDGNAVDGKYDFTDGLYVNTDTDEIGLLYKDVRTERTGWLQWLSFFGEDGKRKLRNSDFVFGMSRDQFQKEVSGHSETARVIMLHPSEYGESYKRPALAIKPAPSDGWVGFIESIFPAISECTNDAATDLVDFEPIEKRVADSYPSVPEDSRIGKPPGCEPVVPYYQILDRASKSGLEALITASIQVLASANFVKCMPVFTYIAPGTENYSNIFNSYIVEVIEESLLDAQSGFGEFFNSFKDHEFWYAFLEQTVQLYVRLVKTDVILEVPVAVGDALTRLDAAQLSYNYPSEADYANAIDIGDQPGISLGPFNISSGLAAYRLEKNLEAVRATEEDAKIVFAELVRREFDLLSKRMNAKLEDINLTPDYSSVDYWFLQTMVDGSLALKLKGTLKDVIQDVPSGPSPHYTSGGELYVFEVIDPQSSFTTGDDYVGFYYKDPSDATKFIAGKEGAQEADSLKVYQNKIIVVDSDDEPIGSLSQYGDSAVPSTGFAIRQVVEIDGSNYSPSNAATTIRSNTSGLNISDVYPGTLAQVLNDSGTVVGLEGSLGVREGVILYYDGVQIASSFIDALDVAIELYEPATANSRLLLCLIDNLFLTQEYKLLTEYIFPIKKFAAMMAIYGDKALLPSIGETIFDEISEGLSPTEDEDGNTVEFSQDGIKSDKPGLFYDTEAYKLYAAARIDKGYPVESPDSNADPDIIPSGYPDYSLTGDVATYEPPLVTGNAGWAAFPERAPGMIARLFTTTWDEWDKILMRNSKSRIKQTFKNYYFARDFKPGDSLVEQKPSEIRLQRLRDQFKIDTAASALPFWRWRKVRPYLICEKTDDKPEE